MTNSNNIEDYFSEERIILSGFHVLGTMTNLNHVGVSDNTVDFVLTYGTTYHMIKKTLCCDYMTDFFYMGENHMTGFPYVRSE